MNNWIKSIKESTNLQDRKVVYLLGNKIDEQERTVTYEEASKTAQELEVKYFEISCKNNMNITEVLYSMVIDCYVKINKTTLKEVFTLNASIIKNVQR